MRIQFDYGWFNDEKTVIRYAARDNWTWKDYHSVVHVSLYAVQSQQHPVHVMIDFSSGKRDRFPSGIAAHARTFGKKLAPNFTGKAIVIGVPEDALQKLGVAQSRVLQGADGDVHFVDDEDAALALLESWT
ncbi:MAG: hypothetical protein AAFU54_07250 [Chloroflexota bacterium]